MTAYVEVVRSLPVPTPEQTRAFAHHVTDDHSWYKQRTLHGYEFVFFLDPNSGRTRLVGRDGTSYEDKADGVRVGSTTESYRRHFGFWNYVWFEAPTIHGADGQPLQVPPDLVKAGTTRVNRLMYGRRRAPIRERQLDLEDEVRFGCIFASVPRPGAASIYDFERAMGIADDLAALPPALAGAMQPLLGLWGSDSYRRELAKLGGERNRDEANAAWQGTQSRRREMEHLCGVITALDSERERQVAGIVKAMEAFLAALGQS